MHLALRRWAAGSVQTTRLECMPFCQPNLGKLLGHRQSRMQLCAQVAELGTGLRDMRLQSSVSLIGRQRVEAADTPRVDAAMSTASAAV